MSRVITFSRHFQKSHPRAGEATYFVEKLIRSFYAMGIPLPSISSLASGPLGLHPRVYDFCEPKLHTIRAGNRWKVGDKFSPRVWAGKPYASKQIIIAPDIEIKSIHTFELSNSEYRLNSRPLGLSQLAIVAVNDGLTCDDFECWFNSKEFQGQVICWGDVWYY